MLKDAVPSELFLEAIRHGFDIEKRAGRSATCSGIWNHIIKECLLERGGFTKMFEWDKSKAKNRNCISIIAECLERGLVPGLRLGKDNRRREIVIEVAGD